MGSGSTPVEAAPQTAETVPQAEAVEPAGDPTAAFRIMTVLAADDRVDARHFSVVVRDGVAELTTTSSSWTEARTAELLAATVDGVETARTVGAGLPERSPEEAEPSAGAPSDTFAEAYDDALLLGTPHGEAPVFEAEGSGSELDQAASGDRPRTYRVGAGDSLSVIASRTLRDGGAWRRIYELNRDIIGPNPERLVEGMELRIPQD